MIAFNTVKLVFFGLKTPFFYFVTIFSIFPCFWQKNVPKKVGPTSVCLFLNFEKNKTELWIRFFDFAHTQTIWFSDFSFYLDELTSISSKNIWNMISEAKIYKNAVIRKFKKNWLTCIIYFIAPNIVQIIEISYFYLTFCIIVIRVYKKNELFFFQFCLIRSISWVFWLKIIPPGCIVLCCAVC